jgi:hypothetical protein
MLQQNQDLRAQVRALESRLAALDPGPARAPGGRRRSRRP